MINPFVDTVGCFSPREKKNGGRPGSYKRRSGGGGSGSGSGSGNAKDSRRLLPFVASILSATLLIPVPLLLFLPSATNGFSTVSPDMVIMKRWQVSAKKRCHSTASTTTSTSTSRLYAATLDKTQTATGSRKTAAATTTATTKASTTASPSRSSGGSRTAADVATTTTSTSGGEKSSSSYSTTGPGGAGTTGTTGTGTGTGTGTSSLRTFGKWEELHGNFLLRPSIEEGPPRALIHFLGGAIVGSSPQVSYRYLLERLAANGYLVVATPYSLSFDHLATCDSVIGNFERIAGLLARTYGALPVVGVGHSCGSLLHLIITTLFPDTPRAANALLSFNNKPVQDAVPLFDQVWAPFFTYAAARDDPNRKSGSDVISVTLKLAKVAAAGELPSDDLLTEASQLLVPSALEFNKDAIADRSLGIPETLREAFTTFIEPARSAVLDNTALVPYLTEALDAAQQIPMLIDEVADGARDFVPPPEQVKAAARRAYRARRTLIIKYEDDPIDESDDIEDLLRQAGKVIRMKRPMVEIDVQRRDLPGGHASPLIAPPPDLAQRAETLLGVDEAKERLLYSQADETVRELVRWLEELNL